MSTDTADGRRQCRRERAEGDDGWRAQDFERLRLIGAEGAWKIVGASVRAGKGRLRGAAVS